MSVQSAVPEKAAPTLRAGALNLTEATVTGLSNMAPAMSLFFAVAFIAGAVGASVPFVFLVAMLGILATANTLAQFTRLFPSAGSFITYITKAFGSTIGTVLGTFLIIGYAVAAGAVYAVLGGWTQNVIQRDLGVSINWVLLMIIGLVILGTLLVIGVQVSTRAALILFLFETAVLLLLGIIIMVNRGAYLSAAPFAPPAATGGLTGIATGFALAIYSFVGWEASAPLAEETDNPTRNVPIALITGVVILAAVYVFITFAVVSAYGVNHISKLANDATPFTTLARVYLGPLRGLVDIAGITSIAASTLALSNTQGRILFHGGRAGIFPHGLSKISARFQTPYIALITYICMVTVAVLVTVWWLGAVKLGNTAFDIYGVLGTFGTLPLIIIYGLTNIALIVYTARHRDEVRANPITHYLLPAIGVILLLAPAWDFFQTTTPPFDRVALYTLVLFIIALIYGLLVARFKPDAAERVGTALEGPEKARGVPA